jgi:hypothetical protein
MSHFMPGLDLSERYFFELVQPLVNQHFPELNYAAALIGYGSEVLGFDTEMSMDHAWAARMQLFVAEDELATGQEIDEMLRAELPTHFLGFPLGTKPSDTEPGVFFMDEDGQPGKVMHKVNVTSVREFFRAELDWDIRQALEAADWLTFPAQVLRVLTTGRVFFDNQGELTTVREKLGYYPADVWLYLLAAGWDRIGQEAPLMQRAGYAGDDLGSAIMASRLCRDIMSLCFTLEKQYAPYPKWFGSAFMQLDCAGEFSGLLTRVHQAHHWEERGDLLGQACELLACKQNDLGLAEAQEEKVSFFHGRPFKVIGAEKFSAALVERISDPTVQKIAKKGLVGSIDQFSDNTVLRSGTQWRQALKTLYC